jgi:hypothetical protein
MEYGKPGYVAPAYVPPAPMPAPAMPIMYEPHDHIHLHASYKHTSIMMPEVEPVFHAPVVAPYSSTAAILVLFVLLVIVARSFHGFGLR